MNFVAKGNWLNLSMRNLHLSPQRFPRYLNLEIEIGVCVVGSFFFPEWLCSVFSLILEVAEALSLESGASTDVTADWDFSGKSQCRGNSMWWIHWQLNCRQLKQSPNREYTNSERSRHRRKSICCNSRGKFEFSLCQGEDALLSIQRVENMLKEKI